jgi:hypothetical protein
VEDQRSGHEQRGIGIRIVDGVERPLDLRHVPRGLHKAPERADGDRMLVHPEVVDLDLPDRPLLGVEVERAHPESAAGDEDHALWRPGHKSLLITAAAEAPRRRRAARDRRCRFHLCGRLRRGGADARSGRRLLHKVASSEFRGGSLQRTVQRPVRLRSTARTNPRRRSGQGRRLELSTPPEVCATASTRRRRVLTPMVPAAERLHPWSSSEHRACPLPCDSTPRYRAAAVAPGQEARGRPADRHPAPTRAQQPRDYLDLPPRHRQRRNHRRRPRPASADGPVSASLRL